MRVKERNGSNGSGSKGLQKQGDNPTKDQWSSLICDQRGNMDCGGGFRSMEEEYHKDKETHWEGEWDKETLSLYLKGGSAIGCAENSSTPSQGGYTWERERERHKTRGKNLFYYMMPHGWGLYMYNRYLLQTKNETSRELHYLRTISSLYRCTQMCMRSIHTLIFIHSYTLHIHNNHFIVFHPYTSRTFSLVRYSSLHQQTPIIVEPLVFALTTTSSNYLTYH